MRHCAAGWHATDIVEYVRSQWYDRRRGEKRPVRGEVAAQYPGGDAQRAADIESGAARPAPLILQDVRAAIDRVEDAWRRMPLEAWSRPTGAHIGQRPAWKSVWARWRETEIHHVDLDAGYTHDHWPTDGVTAHVRVTGRDWRPASITATSDDLAVVRSGASAVLCWLVGQSAVELPCRAAPREVRPAA